MGSSSRCRPITSERSPCSAAMHGPALRSGSLPASCRSSPLPATWSPDGRWIAAFGCVDPCDIKFDTRVLLVRTDGSDTHWLASDQGGNEWGPVLAWAPDGRIALGELGVALVTTTDGSVLQRTTMPGYITGLAWSPDGTELAVIAGDELSVIEKGGSVRDMTPAGGPILWAPDGRSLIFSRGAISGSGSAIWTVPRRAVSPSYSSTSSMAPSM